MRVIAISLLPILTIITVNCTKRPPGDTDPSRLPTGRHVTVDPLAAQNVGSLPINMILTPDAKYAISTTAGWHQALWSIRVADGQGISHLRFQNRRGQQFGQMRTVGLYYGLAASPQNEIFAAQGAHDAIAVCTIDPLGQLERTRTIRCQHQDFPAGLALDQQGKLYVANNDPEAEPPIRKPSSIAIYDTKTGKELGRFPFADSFGGTPNFPLAIAVTKGGKKLYVASQRDEAVYVLDTTDPAKIKPLEKLSTGSHPVALLFNKDQSRLYVANAHSDTISIVNPQNDSITHTILLRPDIARSLAGATPTGLSLSPDEKTLYAALGDMNAVAVIDVAPTTPTPQLQGYIAAGWYPSAVLATSDGQRLLIANAKGTNTRNPNPPEAARILATRPTTKPNSRSPLDFMEGNVITVPLPTPDQLAAQTKKVLENNRLTAKYMDTGNPLAHINIKSGKIRHVIYVIKENRTYDHILGDLKQGNGDPRYCLYPRRVTPNQHALAERFVLLDNFYDSGEVSGDGWTWSTQAMANEYVVRNVPYSYSDRGRYFDYEGMNNMWLTGGFPAKGPDGEPLSQHPDFKDGAPPVPDVAKAPGGHIWDLARKHGLSIRNYGFFLSNGVKTKEGLQVTPDNYPATPGLLPGGRDLTGLTDIDFRRFDMEYPDSDAWKIYYEKTGDEKFKWKKTAYGKYQAPSRFAQWHREFQLMLQKDPTGQTTVPNLMFVRLPTDHTAGANPGMKSPRAMVADNDYAVGQLVQAVSNSPIWKHCAIFIIEDDAQNGPDHVDAHRSVCFIASPYIKRGSIDHTFHNTASCLRTIELLLDLPPMCQYDAVSSPILNWTSEPLNDAPYKAILPPAEYLRETNPEKAEVRPYSPEARLMEESLKMNFERADKAPADLLNEVNWKLIKGTDAMVPATPKSLLGIHLPKRPSEDEDDEDDD